MNKTCKNYICILLRFLNFLGSQEGSFTNVLTKFNITVELEIKEPGLVLSYLGISQHFTEGPTFQKKTTETFNHLQRCLLNIRTFEV